jgi:predicted RNase H-like HicB family nuclease
MHGQAVGDTALHTATRTELDVVKVVLAQEKAWNAGDLEGYVKGYKDSPDTLFVGKEISKGYAQILDDYKHNYAKQGTMGTLAFSELEVHTLSQTFAVCLGKYHLDRSKKEGGARYTDARRTSMIFHVTMEPVEDGWIMIECPALPGCISQGKDEQEALANIKEAITGWLWAEDQKAMRAMPTERSSLVVAV